MCLRNTYFLIWFFFFFYTKLCGAVVVCAVKFGGRSGKRKMCLMATGKKTPKRAGMRKKGATKSEASLTNSTVPTKAVGGHQWLKLKDVLYRLSLLRGERVLWRKGAGLTRWHSGQTEVCASLRHHNDSVNGMRLQVVKVTKHDKERHLRSEMIRTMRVMVIVMKCSSVKKQTSNQSTGLQHCI